MLSLYMHLQEETAETRAMREHILQLLSLPEKHHHLLALQLMESGGIHAEYEPYLQRLAKHCKASYFAHFPRSYAHHVVRLDLHDCEEELPDVIFHCPNLRHLRLRTKLGRLPANIGRLRQVRTLICDKNGLEDLPESMRELQELEVLSLAKNNLIALPAWVGEWKRLESINLSHNLLHELSPAALHWFFLRDLNLASNCLEALPDGVAAWRSLEHINLRSNRLTYLPTNAAAWARLHNADLSCNRLAELPIAARFWRRLRRLMLGKNPLSCLPDWIGEWQELAVFSLSNSPEPIQRTLPNWSFSAGNCGYKSIVSRDLMEKSLPAGTAWTRHKHLPDSTRNWANLRHIDLSHNDFERLPDGVGGWKKVLMVSLAYNRLVCLPAAVGEWHKLRVFFAFRNHLSVLPDSVGNWAALREIYLSYNRLTALPETVAGWKAVQCVWANDNQITCLSLAVAQWEFVRQINFAHNRLTIVPDAMWRWGTKNACWHGMGGRWIDFGHNLIQHVDTPYPLRNFSTTLYLNDNRLTHFPAVLWASCIDLSNNDIEELPSDFQYWLDGDIFLKGNPRLLLSRAWIEKVLGSVKNKIFYMRLTIDNKEQIEWDNVSELPLCIFWSFLVSKAVSEV